MSLSGRESGRPLVGLVLTPPLEANEWMEANLTCMCVWPSFHSSALLGMSSTPANVRFIITPTQAAQKQTKSSCCYYLTIKNVIFFLLSNSEMVIEK